MRFAHFADCHLGGWRQPELQNLNLESFKRAIDICIEEKVNFILFSGDLFDSAYPSIEILKETFSEFKKLKEQGIKTYIIAGSHDYSVSGKTFLDVLERAGFCEICEFEEEIKEGSKFQEGREEENKTITLHPKHFEEILIFGYPGKKSGLEIPDLKKIKIQESNKFKILMLHTTMESARGTLPIDSVDISELPQADYYALGHLHLIHEYKLKDDKYLVYPGPIFPNNFQELEQLKHGSFYIVDVNGYVKLTKKDIKIKEVLVINVEIENALVATGKIISELEKNDVKNKIILLKVRGELKQGKTSDINFEEIQRKLKEQGAYIFLKNTSKLKAQETETSVEIKTDDIEKIEEEILEKYTKENPSKFNSFLKPLANSLSLEKQEDEKNSIFESRFLAEMNKILSLELS